LQEFLDTSDSSEPVLTIAIDHREDEQFVTFLKSLGAHVDRKVLDVGDFLCSARLVIERKTRTDFEQSIIDGRLFSQLPNLISNYERAVVVVEGTSDDGRINRNALLGAYAAIIADFGVSLIFTRNMEATAELVFHFAKHEQIAKKQPMRIYAKKKTHTPSQAVRAIIETFPMVGPKLAKALLNHFGTIKAISEATERDIASVPGVGKKKAKMIYNVIKYNYVDDEDELLIR